MALAGCGLALIALAVAGMAFRRLGQVRAAQSRVLGEHGDRDLIGHSAQLTERVAQLGDNVEGVAQSLLQRLEEAERRLDRSVCHTAVLRYDAFAEGSGRQSSTIALLDDHSDGVVISAILQREQARVYAKPVRNGDSELDLSPEERAAITEALGNG